MAATSRGMGSPFISALVVGLLELGHCSIAVAATRVSRVHAGGRKTTSSEKANPLIARYRELARHYRDDAREAEAAAALWAARSRAAVYGGGRATHMNTQKEMERQGATSLARSVAAVDRMLRDPRPRRAAEAAQRAARPYEEAAEEYRAAGGSYAASANGYALRADNDLALAKQLRAYADQHRLQGGDAAVEPFLKQSQLLVEQAQEFREVATTYSAKSKKIKEALPDIERMAKSASDYAAWTENSVGAVPPHEIYTFTVAPPEGETASGEGS
mmetsp:Transcript_84641/g.248167  ORF Transcript_84641/g.248167 Transcript_84641/m.248167 type:complete len:274 (+) Transcript_84641:110-931(+)